MNRNTLRIIGSVLVAAVVVLSTHLIGPVWAGLGWTAATGIWWWRNRELGSWRRLAIEYLTGLSVVILVALNKPWPTAVALGLIYAIWQLGRYYLDQPRPKLWWLGVATALSLSAIFTATAIWRWPVGLVLVTVWTSSWLVARELLLPTERRAEVLAATWALVATEIAYLFAVWLVSYILPAGSLIVPQAAVVLVALGYCFANIYIAHAGSKLSRARLAEYAIIGLCLLIIVMAGTKWNGAV